MKNTIKAPIFLIILTSLLFSCEKKVQFTETLIDDDGPQSIWMKTLGDINNDGKTDLLVGGWAKGGLVAYLAPEWKKQIINDTLKISTDAEVGDLDNDGTQDIIAIVNHALVWFENPDWQYNVIDSTELHDLEIADLDNNGLLDIVGRDQAEFGHKGDKLQIYYQEPGGKWNKYIKPIANGEGLKLSDLDGDSKLDIVINGYWLKNTGNIEVWEEHKFSDNWEWKNTYIDVADINGDGLKDVLLAPSELAGTSYHISWFEAPENPKTIWKEHIVVDSIETVLHFIGATDFNLDGKMDFMIAHMQQGEDPDEVAIFYQKKNDNWEKQVVSTNGSHSMRLGDFDEDGDMDAFGANWRENIVKMWENEIK